MGGCWLVEQPSFGWRPGTSLRSNQWSCRSLQAGNDALLRAKKEPAEHTDNVNVQKLSLEDQKKAVLAELAELNRQTEALAVAGKAPDHGEMLDEIGSVATVPATDEELAAAAPKRTSPPSSKTTPVKAPLKRHRGKGKDHEEEAGDASTKPPIQDTSESAKVSALQKQLQQALEEVAKMKAQASVPSTPNVPTDRGTPSSAKQTTPSSAQSKNTSSDQSSSAKKTVDIQKNPKDAAGKGPAVPGATDDDHDAEEESNLKALQKYNMIDARLRRLCERKPSGKINVPMAIHEQWKLGGRSRDELRVLLEKYDFDKATFISQMTRIIEKRKEESSEVLSGWFTPEQMKSELKWSSSYIKDACAYCKEHGLVKNDKYSKKVFKFFVEYADKEAVRKSNTEIERASTQEETDNQVALSGNWHDPTEDPGALEPGAGQVQSPEDGEKEIEEKFQNGMLGKLSKITDLMSKLDEYVNGEDKDRVKKSIQALETRMADAQTAFDAFVDERSKLENVKRTSQNTKSVQDAMREAMSKASVLSSAEAQAKALEKSLKKKKKELADAANA